MIEIGGGVAISEGELRFTASRSGGPGGQHVNKVSTRVTLLFDVEGSPSLSPEQKARVLRRLASRVTKEGVLRIVSQASRSQAANRAAAIERLVRLLGGALRREKPRVKTGIPAAAKATRLEQKKRRARIKKERAAPADGTDT